METKIKERQGFPNGPNNNIVIESEDTLSSFLVADMR